MLAAALSLGILLGWQILFPPPEPPRREPPAEASATPAEASATRVAETPTATPEADAPPPPGAEIESLPAVEAVEEQHFVLETDAARAEFSNRGGVLVSYVVKGQAGAEGGELELVAPRGTSPYPFTLVDESLAPLTTETALLAVESEDDPAGRALRFSYRGPRGDVEKWFRLRDDGRLDVETRAPAGAGLLLGPGLRARTREEYDNRFERRTGVYLASGEVETVDPVKTKDPLILPGPGLSWVALEDTYFLAAAVPTRPIERALFEPVMLDATDEALAFDARPVPAGGEIAEADKKLARSLRVYLFARDGALELTTVWGPKQYDRLASLPYGLEKTVAWGFLGFLALPMLAALQWIHGHIVANYGWAIVLLTTALKIVLLPLSIAGFKSMRKMQKLAPRMQAIRERYRPKMRGKDGKPNLDMQRQMNEEVMKLYKEEGVNPAGGCLPLLVQLPIFLAFYHMLAKAVELKWAGWALWIHDLAAPDPYFVLPIVMGVSQLLQQRMSPPPPDPVQRRMMQFLPIVFTAFSLGFPSGLVLYWMTNNILTIGQQMIYNSMRDKAEAEEAAALAPVKGKRGKKG